MNERPTPGVNPQNLFSHSFLPLQDYLQTLNNVLVDYLLSDFTHVGIWESRISLYAAVAKVLKTFSVHTDVYMESVAQQKLRSF